jgi:hypothetical protein
MGSRARFPIVLLIWLVIGVVVALSKDYGDINNASEAATFVLAVILWPIPALDGAVAIRF